MFGHLISFLLRSFMAPLICHEDCFSFVLQPLPNKSRRVDRVAKESIDSLCFNRADTATISLNSLFTVELCFAADFQLHERFFPGFNFTPLLSCAVHPSSATKTVSILCYSLCQINQGGNIALRRNRLIHCVLIALTPQQYRSTHLNSPLSDSMLPSDSTLMFSVKNVWRLQGCEDLSAQCKYAAVY